MTKKAGVLKRHYLENRIVALFDQGKTMAEIATETGVGQRQIRHVIDGERKRREGMAEAALLAAGGDEALSPSVKEKLAAALRHHKRQLDIEFEQRVLDEVRRRIEDTVLPSYNESKAKYDAVIAARRGIMPRSKYRKILACLHPDRSMSDATLREAFHEFEKLETMLCDEKESPAVDNTFPRTYAEMMELRRKASEARRNRRSGMPSRA